MVRVQPVLTSLRRVSMEWVSFSSIICESSSYRAGSRRFVDTGDGRLVYYSPFIFGICGWERARWEKVRPSGDAILILEASPE